MTYIGEKQIKEIKVVKETTPAGTPIIEVEYVDNNTECFSKLMYDKIITDKACDLTTLRDKRIVPVVEIVLTILREWGVKLNELGYLSAMLNKSLEINEKEALKKLWLQYMPSLKSHEEVDLIAVDRVLRK